MKNPVLAAFELRRTQAVLLGLLLISFITPAYGQDSARPSLAIESEPSQAIENNPIRRRWAFLVGIDRYNHLPELHYCSADMRKLRDSLIEYGGYDPECVDTVTYNKDSKLSLSAGLLRVDLMNLLDKVESDDSILFAFSGHGDVDEDGKAWLMAPEAKVGKKKSEIFQYTALSVDEIYERIQGSSAKQKFVILDACHSGGTRGNKSVTKLSFSGIKPGKGILELLSCDADQVSYESKELEQGVFSHFLSEGIAGAADLSGSGDRDGLITANELYDYAHLKTSDFVQKNWNETQTPKRRSDLIGRVVVAVRRARAPEMSADEILVKLKGQEQRDQLPSGFAEQAKAWLACSEDFQPRNDLKKLLELLARGAVVKQEFDRLSFTPLAQVKQNLESEKQFKSRKTYVVAIGIDEYSGTGMPNNRLCKSDATAFANVFRHYGGDEASVELLVDDQATLKALQDSVTGSLKQADAGDLVVIYFAGHGRGGRAISPTGVISLPLSKEPMTNLQRLREPDQEVVNSELSRFAWLPRDVTVAKNFKSASGAFGADQLMEAINDSKADVVVVSDTRELDLPLPSLNPHLKTNYSTTMRTGGEWRQPSQGGRAVLFVGLEISVEREFGTQLQLLLSRLLTGAADVGINQHQPLIGAATSRQRLEGFDDADEVDGKVNKRNPIDVSDGFVSLHEFVDILRYYDERAETYFGCDMRVRGYLPSSDRMITRLNQTR